ncbi:MAG: Hsp20/alpha crystallin family protein [Candidatus Altiarchaeota archaeon]|nr:Hsp20/alpha crystallin family protein [Candidatus Altiarchaeota archaeon]
MTIMDPFDDISEFEKTMKKMLENFFGKGSIEVFGPTQRRQRNKTPGVREPITEINETKDEVIVTIEIPGATKEDISLDVSSNGIEISAKTQRLTDSGEVSGTSSTEFKKFMSLPTDVDPDSVNASYKNGILEIKLKKLKQTKSKKVTIK